MAQVGVFNGTVRIRRPPSRRGGASGTLELRDPFLVRFDGRPRPFLMTERFCETPGCGCNEVLLEFVEFGEDGRIIEDALEFGFWLDMGTWRARADPDRPKMVDSMVDEFVGGMSDELKQGLRKVREWLTKKERNAARFSMSRSDFERGQMVSYADVFGDSKGLMSGGSGVTFRLVEGGKRYLIDDLYCVNPRCKCRETVLAFFEHDQEKEVATQIFDVAVTPGKRPRFDHPPALALNEAEDIFTRWLENDSGALDVLNARRAEMKRVGRRLAAKFRHSVEKPAGNPNAPSTGVNPGRNDRCPCGSGKKYKRCCGEL